MLQYNCKLFVLRENLRGTMAEGLDYGIEVSEFESQSPY